MDINNNDNTNAGRRNFTQANIGVYLTQIQAAFNGSIGGLELDQISIVRLASGDFKCSLKGYKRGELGSFRPSVLYLESPTLSGVFALVEGELGEPDTRWFTDRYPKTRNARDASRFVPGWQETGGSDG